MVLYWSRIVCMHRWVTNYVLVVSKETHITHGNGVHVVDMGTHCWFVCTNCVYASMHYELCTCHVKRNTHHTRKWSACCRCGYVLVLYWSRIMCLHRCITSYVPVISKRTSTSAEMQCMAQTKLSAVCVLVTNYVYASISYELCTCHVQGNMRRTREWSVCCRCWYALLVYSSRCGCMRRWDANYVPVISKKTHTLHTKMECMLQMWVRTAGVWVTNWTSSVFVRKKTDEQRAHES